jgi:hypothetical protein
VNTDRLAARLGEIPSSTGARWQLYLEAYHVLVVLLSYHRLYPRALKDEVCMVVARLAGAGLFCGIAWRLTFFPHDLVRQLISSFKKGLASKWRNLTKPCIYALRLCTLELQPVWHILISWSPKFIRTMILYEVSTNPSKAPNIL